MDVCSWIEPDWPAPPGVRAYSTTRLGGYSQPPFDGFNLGDHVGDDQDAVARNRVLLSSSLELPSEPKWLTQVHGVDVIEAGITPQSWEADAMFARNPGLVCAVLTADCLPLLLCNRSGDWVAAVHAGWRGLADGIIEATLDRLAVPENEIIAWMGPAIGPACFEVGTKVRDSFLHHDPATEIAFTGNGPGRWLADIYQLAKQRLRAHGVTSVWGGEYCTVTDRERFYSYRRDGRTGRMATLVWIEK
ncbi:FIG00003370: Multicopper polyphenol oxidase [hydrothermal vent metagenome]|uniref:FIG00003370: Multicopper polyphenol oxidase n=1 Tax=hydrothermal vent metagenome TaxID=652676 RepID=A0A3B1AUG6_9ZZZZ